jgi:hypothetical protein
LPHRGVPAAAAGTRFAWPQFPHRTSPAVMASLSPPQRATPVPASDGHRIHDQAPKRSHRRRTPAASPRTTGTLPDRWPNYSKVRFRSDQHRANGAPEGSVGYIVEVYDDAYEVEVTEPETGETLFLGAVPDADLDLISGHGPVS